VKLFNENYYNIYTVKYVFPSECTKMGLLASFHPNLLREATALPSPLAGLGKGRRA